MLSSAKYVAIGLVIGMTATAVVVVAIFFSSPALRAYSYGLGPTASLVPEHSSTPLPAFTATPSFTPTFTPVPTLIALQSPTPVASPSPTATLDAAQSMLNSGGLVFAGPLSNNQQIALYRSSLNYVQTTPEDSRRMARAINGVGYGDPTNICGPLAVAILRDAGLMTQDIVPHDFWLLNPLAATDAALLRDAFPAAAYEYSRTLTPINKIDWRASPLLPGDFLFIWHGSGGNFDHMLVVTRVDTQQRVYSVTNYGTNAGYMIGEVMLYDPGDPTLGIFHTWTQERDAILGSTGFGGFELWRRRSP